MFGKNPVTKPSSDTRLPVREIFPTIQGEGPFAGHPAIFVRVGGCPLRCHFCDTDFDLDKSEKLSPEDLVEKIRMLSAETGRIGLVVITGGEPMLYQSSLVLVMRLLIEGEGFIVQVETSGALEIGPSAFEVFQTAKESDRLTVVCSPKTSRVPERMMSLVTHWKYIIDAEDDFSPVDGLPMSSTQSTARKEIIARPPERVLLMTPDKIFVQPMMRYYTTAMTVCGDAQERNTKQCVDLALKFGYRVSLQQHKILNVR